MCHNIYRHGQEVKGTLCEYTGNFFPDGQGASAAMPVSVRVSPIVGCPGREPIMAASPYPSPKKFPALPTSLSRSFYVRHRYNFRAHIDLRHRGMPRRQRRRRGLLFIIEFSLPLNKRCSTTASFLPQYDAHGQCRTRRSVDNGEEITVGHLSGSIQAGDGGTLRG